MRISLYLVIRTADRSEYGWATVEEYKEDKLVENLNDEEKLYRAEMPVGRKCKAAAAKDKIYPCLA